MQSKPKIGLPLLWVGMFLGLLGLLFLLERILLICSNLLIVLGFYFLLGSSKFYLFFTKKKKGTVLYLLGIVLIMVKLHENSQMLEISVQLVGIFVQITGFYFLFEEFLPNLISYLKLTPFNKVLQLPLIKNLTEYISKKGPQLPQ